jgi:hypothetical protein
MNKTRILLISRSVAIVLIVRLSPGNNIKQIKIYVGGNL